MEETMIPASDRPYWETVDYAGANRIVQGNLRTGQQAIVSMGYYLKRIRDERLFQAGGYRNFGEYVRTECGMSESAASRQINIMEYFSEEGNSPKLAEKWVEYSSSKLQELLSMTEEQREKVNPKMTVLQIRNIRKSGECQDKGQMETGTTEESLRRTSLPEKETEVLPVVVEGAVANLLPDVIELEAQEEERLPEENKPERCIFGYSESGFCGAAAYCSELARCCADCDLSCSIRCGWLDQKEQAVSSPGQSEKIQEKDAAWFVKRFLEGRGKEYLPELMHICRKENTKQEKVKEVKSLISPYGAHGGGSSEFGYNFGSYNLGIDFDAENWTQEIHMSYSKFVDILLQIYDPFAPEWNEAEGKEEAQPAAENLDETAGENLATSQEIEAKPKKCLLGWDVVSCPALDNIDACEKECCIACTTDCSLRCEKAVPGEDLDTAEDKRKVPTYDRALLLEMISNEETIMDIMADSWLDHGQKCFTKHAMTIEAFYLLLDTYENQGGDETR